MAMAVALTGGGPVPQEPVCTAATRGWAVGTVVSGSSGPLQLHHQTTDARPLPFPVMVCTRDADRTTGIVSFTLQYNLGAPCEAQQAISVAPNAAPGLRARNQTRVPPCDDTTIPRYHHVEIVARATGALDGEDGERWAERPLFCLSHTHTHFPLTAASSPQQAGCTAE